MFRYFIINLLSPRRFLIFIYYLYAFKFYNENKIQKIRIKKLRRLLRNFMKQEYYKNYIGIELNIPEISLNNFKSFKEVDKKFIRDNFNIINKRKSFLSHRRSTSGSTGTNFQFFVDCNARKHHSASLQYHYLKLKINPYVKTIGIWGVNVKKNDTGNRLNKIKRVIGNTMILPGSNMNEKKALEYIGLINKIKPKILYGYPSYLAFISRIGIRKKSIDYIPKVVILTGEQVSIKDKNIVEEYFKTKTLSRYGSVEFSIIGFENYNAEMWYNPLQFILETNSKGEILVTDLDNYDTPFIRYNIGDIGFIDKEQHLISKLEGRTQDQVFTSEGTLIPLQFWTILSRKHLEITDFQVVAKDSLISFNFLAEKTLSENQKKDIQSIFYQNFHTKDIFDVNQVNELERTKFGKRKLVIKT